MHIIRVWLGAGGRCPARKDSVITGKSKLLCGKRVAPNKGAVGKKETVRPILTHKGSLTKVRHVQRALGATRLLGLLRLHPLSPACAGTYHQLRGSGHGNLIYMWPERALSSIV